MGIAMKILQAIKKVLNWYYREVIVYEWNKLKRFGNWIMGKKSEPETPAYVSPAKSTKPLTIIDLDIQSIDTKLEFSVDTATVAFLDPQTLKHRATDEDWWVSFDDEPLPEIDKGQMTLFSTGIDGFYSMRLTTNPDLTALEKKYCVQLIERAGVEITSGLLAIGDAAIVPGYDEDLALPNTDRGNASYYHLQPGKYDMAIYCLDLLSDDENPEVEGLTDFVVYITPRSDAKFTFKGDLNVDLASGEFLFRS
jgi:hypothetical protein